MSIARALAVAAVATVLAPPPAFAVNDFFVFQAAVTLPVSMVIEQPAAPTDAFATRKLTSNDVINLALGRALGSKIDKSSEVLAVAFSYSEHADLSKLIVWDPSSAQVKATVGQVASIDLQRGFTAKGQSGYAAVTATINATQPPSANGFLASTLSGSGSGGGPYGSQPRPEKIAGKAAVTGRLQFNVNGSPFDGIVLNGKAKASGKILGVFSE